MRIAVCFSGHMRRFEETWHTWKYALRKFDYDVFIHTWDNRGLFVPKDNIILNNEVGTVATHDEPITEDMLKIFGAKNVVIEHYDHVKPLIETISQPLYEWRDTMPEWKWTRPHDFVSYSYKMFWCDVMAREYARQNNFEYDYFIKGRTDLMLQKHFPKEIFLDTDHIWFRAGHPTDPPNAQSVIQEFAIGGSYAMNVYANLFLSFNLLLHDAQQNNAPERVLNHHTATWYWLQKNNIPHKEFPHDSLYILR